MLIRSILTTKVRSAAADDAVGGHLISHADADDTNDEKVFAISSCGRLQIVDREDRDTDEKQIFNAEKTAVWKSVLSGRSPEPTAFPIMTRGCGRPTDGGGLMSIKRSSRLPRRQQLPMPQNNGLAGGIDAPESIRDEHRGCCFEVNPSSEPDRHGSNGKMQPELFACAAEKGQTSATITSICGRSAYRSLHRDA